MSRTAKHSRTFVIRAGLAGGLAFWLRLDAGDAVGERRGGGTDFQPRDLSASAEKASGVRS
jgi:hypothetical protein